MKPFLFIIAQENFRDEELLEPQRIFTRSKVPYQVASQTRKVAVGKSGTELKPDLALPEVKMQEFSGVAFIGGAGSAQYFFDPVALRLAQECVKENKVCAGICMATSILANAGVLIGKKATGFPTEEQNLRNKGAEYTGMPVVIDKHIVTGKDALSAKEFGEALVYELGA